MGHLSHPPTPTPGRQEMGVGGLPSLTGGTWVVSGPQTKSRAFLSLPLQVPSVDRRSRRSRGLWNSTRGRPSSCHLSTLPCPAVAETPIPTTVLLRRSKKYRLSSLRPGDPPRGPRTPQRDAGPGQRSGPGPAPGALGVCRVGGCRGCPLTQRRNPTPPGRPSLWRPERGVKTRKNWRAEGRDPSPPRGRGG